VFSNTYKGHQGDKLKFLTEGLLQAGKSLGFFSRSDAAELMNMANIEVFGQIIEEHENHKKNVKKSLIDDDSDFFNIPAYERLKESAVKNVVLV
jgi:hypothetical protein